MGQVITQPRTDDTPGPGTRGAQQPRQEQETTGAGLGDAWRLVAFLFAVAVAIALGWVLRAQDTDVGVTTTSSVAEAEAIAGEKDAILATGAGAAVVPIAAGQEAATHQQEKEQLVATVAATGTSTVVDQETLHDEKVAVTSRWTGPAAPPATSPLTEQDEKEQLLAW